MKNASRRGLFGGVAAMADAVPIAAASSPATPPAATPSIDAVLLRLGEQLMQAWAIENEAWAASEGEDDDEGPLTLKARELADAAGEILNRIMHEHAKTLPGILVKAQAFQYCRCGRPITLDDVLPGTSTKSPASNERLMVSIMADLNAMGSAVA